MAMTKIEMVKDLPETAVSAAVAKGQHGFLTKFTREMTTQKEPGGKLTYVRFPAGALGIEGREPVFLWIPTASFKVI